LQSQWGRHSLSVGGSAGLGCYDQYENEDSDGWTVFTSGRFDYAREGSVSDYLGYSHLHEDRGSPDNVGGNTPTCFDLCTVNPSVDQSFVRFPFRLSGDDKLPLSLAPGQVQLFDRESGRRIS